MKFCMSTLLGNRLPWCAALALLLLIGMGSAQAQVRPPCYVAPTGSPSNSGTSWQAATDLQTALDSPCTEIWMKQGVYKPSTDTTARAASFTMTENAMLYGGFDGTEQSRGQRDIKAHLTILSGDIDGDDVTNAAGITENHGDRRGGNSYHVLTFDGTTNAGPIGPWAGLDGLVVTGGDAHDSATHGYYGGGLYCGGAGAGNACSPTLVDVSFMGNGAYYKGGAMYNDASDGGTSSPVLNRVMFSGNNAYGNFTTNGGSGGAMFNYATSGGVSSPNLTDVVFRDNRVVWYGGAVFNLGFGTDAVSSPVFNRVTFVNNTAGWYGGGMYNLSQTDGTAKPQLVNVTFAGNIGMKGGAIGNRAWGGIAWPTIINATFVGNSGTYQENSAIYNSRQYSSGTVGMDLVNTILWDSPDGVEIYNESGTVYIDYSIVRGGSSGIIVDGGAADTAFDDGTANRDGDPLLGPLWNNGGFTRTTLLQLNSAAIDNGDDASCPGQDQRLAPRQVRNRCDIGAVERVLPDSDIIFQDGFNWN